MEKKYNIVIVVCLALLLGTGELTRMINNIDYTNQKVNETTNYKIMKEVEDTCRSMISSYESDKLTYEQYIKSEKESEQEWAVQAKIRANKTAVTYNNYVLKNSYVWSDNVPTDIRSELEVIE